MNKTLISFLLIFLRLSNKDCFSQAEADFLQQPALHWKYTAKAPIYSSPVVDNNRVYFGCLDSTFYALEITSGKLLWKFNTNGPIRSTALLTADFIYFISGDGKLYCLNKSGKMIWAFSEGAEKKYDFADYHQSSPIIQNNTLFFGMGDGYVYAVNANDGKLIWKTATKSGIHTTPMADTDKLYVGSFDGYVYALKIADGSIVWSFKTVGHRYFPKGEVQGNPTLSNNCVIIGARDYNVYAIDKEKGYCHWNKTFTKGWVLSNTCKDSLLLMAGADERILACVDNRNGKEIWKRNMEFLMFGKPIFTQSMLYIGTTMGKLHGINAKTGAEMWTFTTAGYQQNKHKYFKEDDTYRADIYSIIKSNEQFLDVEVELGGIFSTPAIFQEFILFTSTEGTLYCLKR